MWWRQIVAAAVVSMSGCQVPLDDPASARPQRSWVDEVAAKLEPPPVEWRQIGRSVEDRPIRAVTLGSGSRQVLMVGGIHGNEREGSVAASEIPAAFLSSPGLAGTVTLTLVEDINPDGSANNTRSNSRGVDLNRDYPSRNRRPGSSALTEPESRVIHDLVVRLQPDTMIVLHSWGRKRTGPVKFINYDGPGERLAQAFSLICPGYPVKESRHLPATPGSIGSWVGVDQAIPTFTVEYPRGLDPNQAWIETREGLLALIRG